MPPMNVVHVHSTNHSVDMSDSFGVSGGASGASVSLASEMAAERLLPMDDDGGLGLGGLSEFLKGEAATSTSKGIAGGDDEDEDEDKQFESASGVKSLDGGVKKALGSNDSAIAKQDAILARLGDLQTALAELSVNNSVGAAEEEHEAEAEHTGGGEEDPCPDDVSTSASSSSRGRGGENENAPTQPQQQQQLPSAMSPIPQPQPQVAAVAPPSQPTIRGVNDLGRGSGRGGLSSSFRSRHAQSNPANAGHPLFSNLDRTVESSGLSPEARKRAKMCLAAMAVVFSPGDDSAASSDGAKVEDGGEGGGAHPRVNTDGTTTPRVQRRLSAGSHRGNDSTAGGDDEHLRIDQGAVGENRRDSLRQGPAPGSSDASLRSSHSHQDLPLDETELPDSVSDAHRPPVPLSVVRMLWARLLRERAGMGRASSSQLQSALDEVQSALAGTLAFVDEVTDFERAPSPPPRSPSRAAQQAKLGGPLQDLDALLQEDPDDEPCLRINHGLHLLYGRHLARTRPDLFFDDAASYDRYIFRAGAEGGSNSGGHCGRGGWDPEIELNGDMAEACALRLRLRSDDDDDDNGDCAATAADVRCSAFPYEYAVEMLPWHLLRSHRFVDAAEALTDAGFVSRRLDAAGMLEGTRMHVADVEEAAARFLSRRRGSKGRKSRDGADGRINVKAIFVRSYDVVSDVLRDMDEARTERSGDDDENGADSGKEETSSEAESSQGSSDPTQETKDPQGVPEAGMLSRKGHHRCPSRRSASSENDDRFVRSLSEIAQSLQIMGGSLLGHGLREPAAAYHSRALRQFELVQAALVGRMRKRGGKGMPGGGGSALRAPAALQGGNGVPSLDRIHFLMGANLSAQASLRLSSPSSSSSNSSDEAMLCYERALSYYSRCNRSRRHTAGVARTLTAMGVLHFRGGELHPAWSCFEEALGMLRELQPPPRQGQLVSSRGHDSDGGTAAPDEVGDVLQWMGSVRREMGDPQSALELLTEALYVKVLLRGRSHPDVGRIHHSIGVVHDDVGEFDRSLGSYEEALRIRRVALKDAQQREAVASTSDCTSSLSSSATSGRKKDRKGRRGKKRRACAAEERELAETLLCKANVCRALGHHRAAYECYLEHASMLRDEVLSLLGDQGGSSGSSDGSNDDETGFLTAAELVDLMNRTDAESSVAAAVDGLYDSLALSLEMAENLAEKDRGDPRDHREREGQVADVLEGLGVLHAARHLHGLDGVLQGLQDEDEEEDDDANGGGKKGDPLEEDKELARTYLEESVAARKRRMRALSRRRRRLSATGIGGSYHVPSTTATAAAEIDAEIEDSQIIVAFALYELGKLYSTSVLSRPRRVRGRGGAGKAKGDAAVRAQCEAAVGYLKRCGAILERMVDLLDGRRRHEDATSVYTHANSARCRPGAAERIQRMPSVLEDTLETMGVLFRTVDAMEEAVECYDTLSKLMTRTQQRDAAIGGHGGAGGSSETGGDQASDNRSLDSGRGSDAGSAASAVLSADANVTRAQKERVAKSIQSMGDVLREQGDRKRAMEAYAEALQIRRALAETEAEGMEAEEGMGERSLRVASTLYAMGLLHLQMEEWEMALVRFDESLRIRVHRMGEEDSSSGGRPEDDGGADDLGGLFSPSSSTTSTTSTSSRRRDVALCLHKMGQAHEGSRKFDLALTYYKDALQTAGKHGFRPSDVDGTSVLCDLGSLVVQMHRRARYEDDATPPEQEDLDLALECLSEARWRCRSHFGTDSAENTDASFLEGEAYLVRGEHTEAISKLESALGLYRRIAPDNHLRIAVALHRLGVAHLRRAEEEEDKGIGNGRRGDHDDEEDDDDRAMERLDESLSILMERGHDGTEDHASVLLDKASVHVRHDETDLAVLCLEVSHRVREDLRGPNDLRVAEVRERLGSCLVRDREHDRAMAHFEDALRIRVLRGRSEDLAAADVHFGMGIVRCENGEYNESLDSYEEALRIRRTILGPNHADVAQILNNIGSVFARNGEYERALKPWRDAIDMYRAIGLSDEHDKVACTLGNVAISEKLVSIPRNRSQKEIRRLDSY